MRFSGHIPVIIRLDPTIFPPYNFNITDIRIKSEYDNTKKESPMSKPSSSKLHSQANEARNTAKTTHKNARGGTKV